MNNALIAIGFMLLLFGTLFMLVGIGFSGELKRNGLSFYFEAPDGSPAAMADYVKTNTMRMMLVSWIAILLTSGIISIILGVLGFRVTPEALPPPASTIDVEPTATAPPSPPPTADDDSDTSASTAKPVSDEGSATTQTETASTEELVTELASGLTNETDPKKASEYFNYPLAYDVQVFETPDAYIETAESYSAEIIHRKVWFIGLHESNPKSESLVAARWRIGYEIPSADGTKCGNSTVEADVSIGSSGRPLITSLVNGRGERVDC